MCRSNKLPYLFFSLQGISLMGSRMTSIAVGIKLFHETGQATPLLLLSLFNEPPLLFFGTWIGIAADRWKRKTAILAGDTGQMLCTALLVLCLNSENPVLWPIYGIAAVQGMFMALQSAATATMIPLMVREEELDRMNALKELLFPLAGVIAPSMTGMLYEPYGMTGILFVDILTFLIGTGLSPFCRCLKSNVRKLRRKAVADCGKKPFKATGSFGSRSRYCISSFISGGGTLS
ncbi:MFS transporter [Paenibacillus sp. P25]|nr:MFS transporter [Paenibacillus sp. P25]